MTSDDSLKIVSRSGSGTDQSLSLPIFLGDEHPCPYLPLRNSRNQFTFAQRIDPRVYQQMMDVGFRRSGLVVYRPICTACQECIPIRVPVEQFKPSRSQNRALKKNRDVRVSIAPPEYSSAKWDVYARYLQYQHDGTMSDDPLDLQQFLYSSVTDTLEMTYTLAGRIIAVGIVDITDRALSSVYFFFDPEEHKRSLGVFGALIEIEECRRRGLPYWYVGYYIRDCDRMNYKAGYRPAELLGSDGNWKAIDANPAGS